MGAVPKSVASAVPSAVSSANSVQVDTAAQRGPYQPSTGSSTVPYVPGGNNEMLWQPGYAGVGDVGQVLVDGSTGAPSLPVDGTFWRPGPADPHYMAPSNRNPYAKIDSPATSGWLTFVKSFANHIWQGKQNVDAAGWQQSAAQQRTSYMRVTPPPHGDGYAPESYIPRQMPQQAQTYRFNPVTGTDVPGVRILNSSTFGAGQVAGGIGGNQYTPAPGPPETTSTAAGQNAGGGMPVWG